jgi:hypothetical protein
VWLFLDHQSLFRDSIAAPSLFGDQLQLCRIERIVGAVEEQLRSIIAAEEKS